jgi:hypothetical protein
LQQLPKLTPTADPEKDAADTAVTEFCKSTVATTKINPKRIQQEFGREATATTAATDLQNSVIASFTDKPKLFNLAHSETQFNQPTRTQTKIIFI